MGIYGESISLVTEGKITDKIKKFFDKVIKKSEDQNKKAKDNKPEKQEVKQTQIKQTENVKHYGHFAFYKKYIYHNYDKIFCKITKESSEKYLKEIENIFGSDNRAGIAELYKKDYNKEDFEYSDEDLDIAYDDKDHLVSVKGVRLKIADNVKATSEYEKEMLKKGVKYDPEDPFNKAVILQIDLWELANALLNDFINDSK